MTSSVRPERAGPGILRRLLADQRVRFLIVGGVNTALGYSVFAALHMLVFDEIRFGYMYSLVLSYLVAITLAFVLYRRFVFMVSGRVLRDFVAFVGVYAVAIACNVVLLPLLVEAIGLPPLVAQALVVLCTTVISFFGHREVSFRRPTGPPTS
jgi:putative flippase GtrA